MGTTSLWSGWPGRQSCAIRIKQRRQHRRTRTFQLWFLRKAPPAPTYSFRTIAGSHRPEQVDPWLEGRGAPLNQPVTDVPGASSAKTQPSPPISFSQNAPTTAGTTSSASRSRPVAGRTGRRFGGVEIFPSFAAAEVLYNGDGSVRGVTTGNMESGAKMAAGRQLPAWHGTGRQIPSLPEGAGAISANNSSQIQNSTERQGIPRPTASASGIIRKSLDPSHATAQALSWMDVYGEVTPMAVASCTTWMVTRLPWASLPGTEPCQPIWNPLKSSSAGRPIPISVTTSRTTRAKSPPNAGVMAPAPSLRWRASVPAQDGVSWWRAGGLRRGFPQRLPDQGQPRRHQDGHVGR